MAVHLVEQLRFARSELLRGLDGITDDDARRRFAPMNCISWMIGHLATQEQFLWVLMAQGKIVDKELYKLVGHGQPASTPPLDEMWTAWRAITAAADDYLATLTPAMLTDHNEWDGRPWGESIGTSLYRNLGHYWYHIGEAMAVRQLLGHTDLPEFVGNLPAFA